MAKVLIIQSVMKHYRVPFFVQLHDALALDGIELTVAYSSPNDDHATRRDDAELPSAWSRKVKAYWFRNLLIFQPLWRDVMEADLVIVTPEIKILNNPLLLLMSFLNLKKVAFWGLGPNKHPGRSDIAEWVKALYFNKVDWWFAYTEGIASYLRSKGMPAERVTAVQNSTDSSALRAHLETISDREAGEVKIALTGDSQAKIGLYCGMMQKIKDLPFLLETARLVKAACPPFHLVLIGSGPEREWLEANISGEPWIHYLGSKFERESAVYYKIADVFLLGGTAGLAVVDSFAAGLPVLTTELTTHPPEIEYVKHQVNGLISTHTPVAFAAMVSNVLQDSSLMASLRHGAVQAGVHYTMQAMVCNFARGIRECIQICGIPLSLPKRQQRSGNVPSEPLWPREAKVRPPNARKVI